jgi:hypothetical protein
MGRVITQSRIGQRLKAQRLRGLYGAAQQRGGKVVYFAILSEARNLSSIWAHEKKERFFASLRMTKFWRGFFRSL